MLGKKSFGFWLWWRTCWFFLSPCCIVVSTTSHNVPETQFAQCTSAAVSALKCHNTILIRDSYIGFLNSNSTFIARQINTSLACIFDKQPLDLPLQLILVWSLVNFKPRPYAHVPYPGWGLSLGWCITAFVVLWIPVVAVYKLFKADGNLWKVCNVMYPYKKMLFQNLLVFFSMPLKAYLKGIGYF